MPTHPPSSSSSVATPELFGPIDQKHTHVRLLLVPISATEHSTTFYDIKYVALTDIAIGNRFGKNLCLSLDIN